MNLSTFDAIFLRGFVELSLDKRGFISVIPLAEIDEILFHVLRFNFFLVLREVDSKSFN
jgi:hypothetical protein